MKNGQFSSNFAGTMLVWVLYAISFCQYGSANAQNYQLQFDGTDYVLVADSDALDLSDGAFTLSAWIRPDGWGQNSQGRIVDHGGGSSGGSGWSLHVENKSSRGFPQALRLQINGDSSFFGMSDAGVLNPGIWQHVAVTYSAGTLRFYVDGTSRGVSTGVPVPLMRADSIRIGARTGDAQRGFDGAIDELRIWDRELSAQEILDGMRVALTGGETGLLAYYRFNEGNGQSAGDSSPYGHHGQIGSNAGVDGQDPAWINAGPPFNIAPIVNAGGDQSIALPADTVNLTGVVTDDGLPSGILDVTWTVINGPSGVSIVDANSAATIATFNTAGVYTLRLSASDAEFSAADDMSVMVYPSATLASVRITPDAANLFVFDNRQFQAAGTDQTGQPYPISPAWSASGGSIDASGVYQAGNSLGQYQVSAIAQGVSDQALVNIVGPIVWPTNGWETASPADANMDAALLLQARDYALTGNGAGYITRRGKIIMVWGDATRLYNLASTTKSIGSLALGLAIQDGLISLSNVAQTYLPGIGMPPNSNTQTGWLDNITILQLATQTAGFDKPGGYIDLLFQPGTTWAYTDGGQNWLADTLTVAYQIDLLTLLRNRILGPLGVPDADLTWRDNKYRKPTLMGIDRREFGSGISSTVDVMARIGYLTLRGGNWDGVQLIPQSFVDQLRTTVTGVSGLPVSNDTQLRFANAANHYGIMWWNNADGTLPDVPTDAFWAWGLSDSLIVVIPSLEIVATRAGNAWSGSRNPSFYQVLDAFITPIAQSVFATNINQVPIVSAGINRQMTWPTATLNLNGSVTDDGLPSGSLQANWSVISGSGAVSFANSAAVNTSATFPMAGIYVLQLTADDGEFSSFSEITVTVQSSGYSGPCGSCHQAVEE